MFYRLRRFTLLSSLFIILFVGFLSPVSVNAQGESTAPYSRLDPRSYNPEKDPDIDLFFNNWAESTPRSIHGGIIVRDILTSTSGDPLKPSRKGAVLTYITSVSYGTLYGYASTQPVTLQGFQEIMYFISGQGFMQSGDTRVELHRGMFVLIPSELPFAITNTGEVPLNMYIVREPVPEGFRPNDSLLIVDEDNLTIGPPSHWSHLAKRIFLTEDGLGTLQSMYVVYFDPMTMGQPHSHVEGCEEVWLTVEGDNVVLLGKELRRHAPGTAFKIPPDGANPHSSINTSDKPVKMVCFARYGEHEVRK